MITAGKMRIVEKKQQIKNDNKYPAEMSGFIYAGI